MKLITFLAPKEKLTGVKWAGVFFVLLLMPLYSIIAGLSRPAAAPGLPLAGKVLAIDPGHGGYDPGVVRNNVTEKSVVLAISLVLRDYLQSAGARVTMTRETDRDLLMLPAAGPKKRQDMRHRLHIIHMARPDILVSIHANAMGSVRWRGAQVFYKKEHEKSKRLANYIRQELIRVLENTDREIKQGDYFILNEAKTPAVLVETGFISNPDEAELLRDPMYQSRIAWAIYLGITRYFAEDGLNQEPE